MKKLFVAVTIVAAAFLAGCDSSAKLNQIHIGMTKDQVVGIMGAPDSTSAQANMEYYTYYLVNDSEYGRDQPYMIRFVDNKVESFGRMLQLFDAYNRPVAGSGQMGTGMTIMPGTNGAGPQIMPTMGGGNAAPPAVVRVTGTVDLATELQKLKELKDQGVLTDDEFQQAKTKLLANLK